MYILQSKLFTLLPVKIKTNNNKHVICQLHNLQLQKEGKSNPKQPSYNKKCVAPRMLLCEIQSWRPRNGCDGGLIAKF